MYTGSDYELRYEDWKGEENIILLNDTEPGAATEKYFEMAHILCNTRHWVQLVEWIGGAKLIKRDSRTDPDVKRMGRIKWI